MTASSTPDIQFAAGAHWDKKKGVMSRMPFADGLSQVAAVNRLKTKQAKKIPHIYLISPFLLLSLSSISPMCTHMFSARSWIGPAAGAAL